MRTSSLSKYLEKEKQEALLDRVLIFDAHNLIFRTLHVAAHQLPEDLKFNFWKYLLLNSFLTSIKKFSPDRVVFALDSRNNWRKDPP